MEEIQGIFGKRRHLRIFVKSGGTLFSTTEHTEYTEKCIAASLFFFLFYHRTHRTHRIFFGGGRLRRFFLFYHRTHRIFFWWAASPLFSLFFIYHRTHRTHRKKLFLWGGFAALIKAIAHRTLHIEKRAL
jgi:hypothetical protein